MKCIIDTRILLRELPFHHRDPFDRMIITQAMRLECPVMTIDPAFALYPILTKPAGIPLKCGSRWTSVASDCRAPAAMKASTKGKRISQADPSSKARTDAAASIGMTFAKPAYSRAMDRAESRSRKQAFILIDPVPRQGHLRRKGSAKVTFLSP